MKKVLIVLLAGGFFASCNNAADNTQREKDSLDSIAREKKDVIDSTTQEKKDELDSAARYQDSVQNAQDTAAKK